MKIVLKVLGVLIFLLGAVALAQFLIGLTKGRYYGDERIFILVTLGMMALGAIAFFLPGRKK